MYTLSSTLLKSVVLLFFAILHLNGCASYLHHKEITKTKDGGYIIVKDFSDIEGGKTVLKLQSDLKKEWQIEMIKEYQGKQKIFNQSEIFKLIEMKDGGYIGVGRNKWEERFESIAMIKTYTSYSPLIFRLDSHGKKFWETVRNNSGYLVNVIQISNSDFIACGANILEYERNVFPQERALFIRFDQFGKEIWSKEISDVDTFRLIIQTEDGGILLVGTENNGIPSNLYVAKFDHKGMHVWQKIINIVADGSELVEHYGGLLESNDGSYVIAGSIMFGKNENYIFILCLESDGELKWKTLIKPEDTGIISLPPNIYDIKQLTTNDYIVVGTMVVPGKSLGFLSKISSDGQELWTVGTYNDGKREILRRIHANPDGSYTLYGLSSEEGSGKKIWTLKLSANGEIMKGH